MMDTLIVSDENLYITMEYLELKKVYHKQAKQIIYGCPECTGSTIRIRLSSFKLMIILLPRVLYSCYHFLHTVDKAWFVGCSKPQS
jgi:hypothetical protein